MTHASFVSAALRLKAQIDTGDLEAMKQTYHRSGIT